MAIRARRPSRLFWKLFLVNLAIVCGVLVVGAALVLRQIDRFHNDTLVQLLQAQSESIEVTVRDAFARGDATTLDTLARQIGSAQSQGLRVTFILADGTVVGDSHEDPDIMENHADRPEVGQALLDARGQSRRWSNTIKKGYLYLATRVGSRDAPIGTVRIAMPVEIIGLRGAGLRNLVNTAAGVAILIASLLLIALSSLWSRRITAISDAARELSSGDLTTQLDVGGRDEVAALARSLSDMRDQISRQVRTIEQHSRTLSTMISEFNEGIVIVNDRGIIVSINPEATRLLSLPATTAASNRTDVSAEHVITQHQLQGLMFENWPPSGTASRDATRADADPDPGVQVETPNGHVIKAHAFDIRLPDAENAPGGTASRSRFGRVLVLRDITETTRAMRVKTDFAANASHELRTPLATLRASVETLAATDWTHDLETSQRCIRVIERQTARMEQMAVDLLDLSRLESATSRFEAEEVNATAVFDHMHDVFKERLATRELRWETHVDPQCRTLPVSGYLFRIVIRNLVENAIRFTGPGGRIVLSARVVDDVMNIMVSDSGCGISPEHLPRVFERFYQAENGASEESPGTGLGLAIVRHAVLTMDGTVDIDSTLGQGTTVTVRLPLPADDNT